MNQVAIDIWPMVLTALLTAVGTYVGFIHRLRIRVATLQVEVDELKRRVEGHSKKQDDILAAVHGIQSDMNDKLSKIAVDIAKINTTLTIIEPSGR